MNMNRKMAALMMAAALIGTADASTRRFAYNYEAETMPAGHREYETVMTWKTSKATDNDFDRIDIRHEFEFGLTDNLQLALYLPDWRYEESDTESGRAEIHDIAVELIYGLTDPTTHLFGTAIYGEVKVSDDFIELESKFLLQKNVGQWSWVYNIGAAIEWEENYEEDKAELVQTMGLSYMVNPRLAFGAEVVHECAIDDVEDFGDQTVYLGPNISCRSESWWVTLAPLWQVTDVDDEADFQLRAIIAFEF